MRRLALLAVVPVLLVACKTEVPNAALPDSGNLVGTVVTDAAYSGRTEIDYARSSVKFIGKSSIVNHEGSFSDFRLMLTPDSSDAKDLSKATIRLSLNPAGIKTDSEMLDGHLQKEDFFDTAKNPEILFVSTAIVPQGENNYSLTGYLTLKGKVQEVTIPATITDDSITAHYQLPRKEFGIGNDSYGDKLLDEYVPVDAVFAFAR